MHLLPITYISVTDDTFYSGAKLKASHPIAYADAFAVQLAIKNGCSLATGDKDFQTLQRVGVLALGWMGA